MKHTTTELTPETEIIFNLAIAQMSDFNTADDVKVKLKQNYVLIQSLIAMQLMAHERLGVSNIDGFLDVLVEDAKLNYQKEKVDALNIKRGEENED